MALQKLREDFYFRDNEGLASGNLPAALSSLLMDLSYKKYELKANNEEVLNGQQFKYETKLDTEKIFSI